MSRAIQEITDADYTHAALLVDESTNTISEAFFPHVRSRQLENSELAGIDVFDISSTYPNFTPLTDAQVAGVLDYCAKAESLHVDYSIANLFRFLPCVRGVIGQAQDTGVNSDVFCSQYAFDAVARGGSVKLLNAPSYKLAPGYLQWSSLLVPAPQLSPIQGQPQSVAAKTSVIGKIQEAASVVESAIHQFTTKS